MASLYLEAEFCDQKHEVGDLRAIRDFCVTAGFDNDKNGVSLSQKKYYITGLINRLKQG